MVHWFIQTVLWLLTQLVGTWQTEQIERGRVYIGKFVVWDHGRGYPRIIPSRIIEKRGSPVAVYLRDVPRSVWEQEHGECLQLASPGSTWYRLHFIHAPRSFASAYDYVQSFLGVAL